MPAPGQFFPRKSRAHRIACIALYRALLKQCPLVPLPADLPLRGKINPIEHFVKKEFRRNVWHSSSKMIVGCLETGYAVHALLHHASTFPQPNPSLTQIHSLLTHIHATHLLSRILSPQKTHHDKTPILPRPGVPPLLTTHPLPKEKLKGVRRVPKLVVTLQQYPFLRYGRLQSPYLSRVLRQRMAKRRVRQDRVDELETLSEQGEWEDSWEENLPLSPQQREKEWEQERWSLGLAAREKGQVVVGWGKEAKLAAYYVVGDIKREEGRSLELGKRMAGVLGEEEKLWKEERRKRLRAKRRGRMRRSKVRKRAEQGKGIGGVEDVTV